MTRPSKILVIVASTSRVCSENTHIRTKKMNRTAIKMTSFVKHHHHQERIKQTTKSTHTKKLKLKGNSRHKKGIILLSSTQLSHLHHHRHKKGIVLLSSTQLSQLHHRRHKKGTVLLSSTQLHQRLLEFRVRGCLIPGFFFPPSSFFPLHTGLT